MKTGKQILTHIHAKLTGEERAKLATYVKELNNIGGLRFERSDIYGRILIACMESDKATEIIREAIKKMAREAV